VHVALRCAACGLLHDPGVPQNLCTACQRPLVAEYDLGALRGTWSPADVRASRERGLWRFRPVLPVAAAGRVVSLGEGGTPLLRAERRGPFAVFRDLWIKDESGNPTGSFKARGMATAVTRAADLGIRPVALPSAGNAGGAAVAYAARAGMECLVFMPEDTPSANILEAVLAGARVHRVNGLISDCGKLVKQGCARFGWFDLSTLKEPFRLEGKKTMGYELPFDLEAEAGEFRLPDAILYPTGGGTGLIGMGKAFDEMERLGWIGSARPRMVVVQAAGCAPIVRAFERGEEHAELFPQAHTIASGLRVPAAVADFMMLRTVRQSGGTAVAVTDDELLQGVHELARWQGIYACPEAGAVWTAAQKLLARGWLRAEERIVLFNTGTGHKYNDLIPVPKLPVLDHRDPDCLSRL